MTKNKPEQNPNSVKVLLIVLIVLVAVLVGVVIFLLTRKLEEPEKPNDTRATVITEENVEEVLEQMSKPVEAAYYNCQMNVNWHFVDSTQPSYDAYVANATLNTYTVYFDVNLENGDMVYSSPYIPVGEELTGITLDKQLDAGEYKAIVTYHLVDQEHKELSQVSVSVMLHIEQ